LLADGLPEEHPARAEVSSVEAVGACGCGTCPSIELSPAEGVEEGASRLVVSADHPEALLLLFVDGGHLSFLVAAEWRDDHPVLQFPRQEEIRDVRGGGGGRRSDTQGHAGPGARHDDAPAGRPAGASSWCGVVAQPAVGSSGIASEYSSSQA